MSVRLSEKLEWKSTRRSPWRQQLVDAETGFRLGLRTDSTLFARLFLTIIIVIAAAVIGFSVVEWGVVLLALGMGLSAELFRQLLRQIVEEFPRNSSRAVRQCLQIGTAAALTANVTALLVIGVLFWNRIGQLWSS